MELITIYMGCAALGGAVLVLQILMLLVFGGDGGDVEAFDGGADVDGDVEAGDGLFKLLSVQAVSAFVAFFGLTGWWGTTNTEWGTVTVALVALLVGVVAMLVVAWLLQAQKRLQSVGNLDPAGAVGKQGRVYLVVPGKRKGHGKITLELQGRTAEYRAFTEGRELPTGTEIRVVRMTSPGTFEVAALD